MVRLDKPPFNLLVFNQIFVFLLLFLVSSVMYLIAWLELQCAQHLGPAAKPCVGLVCFSRSLDLTSCVKSQ